jgi:hypothetical protein
MGMIYDLDTGILLYHTADFTSRLPDERGNDPQGSECNHQAFQSATD